MTRVMNYMCGFPNLATRLASVFVSEYGAIPGWSARVRSVRGIHLAVKRRFVAILRLLAADANLAYYRVFHNRE